jgi:hypothetical protein
MNVLNRRLVVVGVVALIVIGAAFRVIHLASMPGVSGDEGWWGIQALTWLDARPIVTRTTSGNPTDMFFLIPLAVVHTLGGPSFVLLRALPAWVNVAALPIAFVLTRRVYGATTATILTVAVAVAPTVIAHSRICQEPSQSIVWTAIVILTALRGVADRAHVWRFFWIALLLFPIAIWTQPTNIFIAPFVGAPLCVALAPRLPSSNAGRVAAAGAVATAALLVVLVALPGLRALAEPSLYLSRPWLSLAGARVIDPSQWAEFVVNYARLFSGVTVYRYFSGAEPLVIVYDAAFAMIAIATGLGVWRSRRAHSRQAHANDTDIALLVAFAATWLLFFAFAGPEAIRPHQERWGLCLIVPGTLVLARGLAGWIGTGEVSFRRPPIAVAGIIAAALLVSFDVNYFREFATTGGRSHQTYVTASPEPKQQALALILARRAPGDRVTIVAQQWWHYWPLAYLARGEGKVSVMMSLGTEAQPQFQEALYRGQLFIVEFVGSPELQAGLDWIRARHLASTASFVRDASGRELFEILQVGRAR